MKFIVIGDGIVGQAIYSALEDHHTVVTIDPEYGTGLKDIEPAKNVDGFIICVPTPNSQNNRCEDSLVSDYVQAIRHHHPDAQILIKSTTTIDTLRGFSTNVTFSPEFLRGSNADANPTQEFLDSNFAIYGGEGGEYWHGIFGAILDIKEVRYMSLADAGFLKYTENSFLALKVMFFNELHNLYSQTVNEDFSAMTEALALDKRIGNSHMQVPGPDGQTGFGGHCLPKDINEFIGYAENAGVDTNLHLLTLVRALNEEKYRKVEEEVDEDVKCAEEEPGC